MSTFSTELKEQLGQALAQVEHQLSRTKYTLKEKLQWLEPIMIMPYYGFGNERYVYLKGRVLENEQIIEKKQGSSPLEHLRNIYKRYESDEIPGIRLKASFADQQLELQTDDEGFFEVAFHFEQPIDYGQWGTTIRLQLLETKTPHDQVEALGTIFVPDSAAEYGIISDIDDTVLVSNMTHFLGRLKLLLLNDATERSPFPGIAALLRALGSGYDNQGTNPLFYVSGSEWNLFDLLVHFFRFHQIPQGPLLLRDRSDVNSINGTHKLAHIRHILETYPHLKFICIGDSGQRDAEIYSQVVAEFGGRILGVYIRDVSDVQRDEAVQQLAHRVQQQQGVQMLLVADTLAAAEHAQSRRWINADQLAQVRQACSNPEPL
jgi:phosphatidate phosphatase APP1